MLPTSKDGEWERAQFPYLHKVHEFFSFLGALVGYIIGLPVMTLAALASMVKYAALRGWRYADY